MPPILVGDGVSVSPEDITLIKGYCSCLSLTSDAIVGKLLNQVIRVISSQTCWTDGFDGSFLSSERIMVRPFCPARSCGCKDDTCEAIDFDHRQVTSFTSVEVIGLSRPVATYTLPSPKQYFNSTLQKYLVCGDWQLEDTITNTLVTLADKCCPAKYTMVLRYTAGWDAIPKVLYDPICKLLGMALEVMNSCDTAAGAASKCSKLDAVPYNAYLKKMVIDSDSWAWEIPDNILKSSFDMLFANGSMAQIFAISNCGRRSPFVADTILPR
jgi:hypothetical protein